MTYDCLNFFLIATFIELNRKTASEIKAEYVPSSYDGISLIFFLVNMLENIPGMSIYYFIILPF